MPEKTNSNWFIRLIERLVAFAGNQEHNSALRAISKALARLLSALTGYKPTTNTRSSEEYARETDDMLQSQNIEQEPSHEHHDEPLPIRAAQDNKRTYDSYNQDKTQGADYISGAIHNQSAYITTPHDMPSTTDLGRTETPARGPKNAKPTTSTQRSDEEYVHDAREARNTSHADRATHNQSMHGSSVLSGSGAQGSFPATLLKSMSTTAGPGHIEIPIGEMKNSKYYKDKIEGFIAHYLNAMNCDASSYENGHGQLLIGEEKVPLDEDFLDKSLYSFDIIDKEYGGSVAQYIAQVYQSAVESGCIVGFYNKDLNFLASPESALQNAKVIYRQLKSAQTAMLDYLRKANKATSLTSEDIATDTNYKMNDNQISDEHLDGKSYTSILLEVSEINQEVSALLDKLLKGTRRTASKDDSNKKTHYELFGVPIDSSLQQIRANYRAYIFANHPDKIMQKWGDIKQLSPQDSAKRTEEIRRATEASQQATAAYDVLSDPNKRSRYDMSIKTDKDTHKNIANNSEYTHLFANMSEDDWLKILELKYDLKNAQRDWVTWRSFAWDWSNLDQGRHNDARFKDLHHTGPLGNLAYLGIKNTDFITWSIQGNRSEGTRQEAKLYREFKEKCGLLQYEQSFEQLWAELTSFVHCKIYHDTHADPIKQPSKRHKARCKELDEIVVAASEAAIRARKYLQVDERANQENIAQACMNKLRQIVGEQCIAKTQRDTTKPEENSDSRSMDSMRKIAKELGDLVEYMIKRDELSSHLKMYLSSDFWGSDELNKPFAFYAVLGLDSNATTESICAEYKKMLAIPPDNRLPSDKLKLNIAEVLKCEDLRLLYDKESDLLSAMLLEEVGQSQKISDLCSMIGIDYCTGDGPSNITGTLEDINNSLNAYDLLTAIKQNGPRLPCSDGGQKNVDYDSASIFPLGLYHEEGKIAKAIEAISKIDKLKIDIQDPEIIADFTQTRSRSMN